MTITRVGIVAKQGLSAAAPHLEALIAWLGTRGLEVIVETGTAELAGLREQPALSRDALPSQIDLLVVLGGDGTMLGMAARIGGTGRAIPILGVNFGRLGFLTEVTLDELYPTLEGVLDGTARVQERRLLSATVLRRALARHSQVVLNDVVVTRGEISRVIDLEVAVDGEFVTRAKADGIIVSTPTGSTAYNLAASGPIVHPEVDAIVITPIAPHTLANRPIVIPGTSVVEVRTTEAARQGDVFATFDGQTTFRLDSEDVVRVTRAEASVRIVRSSTRTYFDTLREKLGWGGR
jgi:NAD+ kinase